MRKLYYMIVVAALLGMVGCSESEKPYEEPEVPENPATSDDPDDSDVSDVILSYVSVYADAAGNRPVVENIPLTSETTTLRFALPFGLNEVYVNYPTADGVKSVKMRVEEVEEPTETRAADPGSYDYFYRLEDKRYVELVYTKPEMATPAYVTANDGFTSYHSSGVVMFEDTWPSKSNVDGKGEGDLFIGDYNDLVVDYDLETNIKGNPATDMSSARLWRDLKVVLHFRAKGGSYPRAFGLKLENLLKEFVWNEEPAMYWSMSNHGTCAQTPNAEVKWDNDRPVIYVSGLEKLTDKLFMDANGLSISDYNGSKFYNSVNDGKKANSNSGKGLLTLTVTFRGNLAAEHDKVVKHFRDAVMDTRQQNFFLVTEQAGKSYEIHLAGYEPTGFYTSYEVDKNDSAAGKTVEKDENVKYRAADGNVWAMKTPVLTRHATEQNSFAAAFPQYKMWLETGAEEYSAWYLNENANMEVDENGVLKFIINPW